MPRKDARRIKGDETRADIVREVRGRDINQAERE